MTVDEKYKAIKKRLGLKDEEIAQIFGYKDANGFRNSARRESVVKGIVELYEAIIYHLKIEE